MSNDLSMTRVFVILAINIVSSVSGQLLLKMGMRNMGGFSLEAVTQDPLVVFRIIFNPFIFIGLVLYVINVFLWLDVISRADLSYVYPFLSISYAAVVIASWLILGEQMSWTRIVGVAVVTVGVYLISRS
jgi:multidrug transporter EmrE-like cation transporter